MTTVDQLRAARSKAPVKYKEFTTLYKEFGSEPIYFLFEGEDSKYYGIRIETIVEPSITPHFLNCGGKEEVLRFYKILKFHEEYKDVRFAYFIDRDFDQSIEADEIYETPCYSIENFYTSLEAFQRILEREFNLSRRDLDFKKCSELYQTRQKEFHNKTRLLNAWVACQRDYSKVALEYKRANIKDLKIEDLVLVDLDSVISNYTIDILNARCPQAFHPPEEVINQKLAEFESFETQKHFRGKFEIFFLFKFVTKLAQAANNADTRYFSKKIKVSLNIQTKTIISNFSHHADTPDCLKRYLKSFRHSCDDRL